MVFQNTGGSLGKPSALLSISYGFFSKISQLQKTETSLLPTSLQNCFNVNLETNKAEG